MISSSLGGEDPPNSKTHFLLDVAGGLQSPRSSQTKPFVPLFLSFVTFQLSGSVAVGVRAPSATSCTCFRLNAITWEAFKGSRRGPRHGFLWVLLRLCKNVPLKNKKKKKQIPLGLRLLCAQPRSCKGRNFCLEAVIFLFLFFLSS